MGKQQTKANQINRREKLTKVLTGGTVTIKKIKKRKRKTERKKRVPSGLGFWETVVLVK